MRPTSRAFFLSALLLLPALAAAQDAREEILAADARRFEAMIRVDQAALNGLLADDLTYTHSSGQLESKAQFLESLRAEKIRYLSAERSDVAVRLYGDTAVVTGRAQIKAVLGGQEAVLPLRFTEVWVKSGGAWKLTAWQSTRVQ